MTMPTLVSMIKDNRGEDSHQLKLERDHLSTTSLLNLAAPAR